MRAVFVLLLMVSAASAQSITKDATSWITKSVTANPPYYTYAPKPDITAQELSEVVKLLLSALACDHYYGDCGIVDQIDKSPPQIKRHFVRHED